MIKSRLFALVVCAASLASVNIIRADDSCSAATVNVKYAYLLNGTIYDNNYTPFLLSAVGVASPDGAGNISGSESFNLDGTGSKRTYTGTYTVNADCTGSMTLNYSDKWVLHFDFVILDDAKEISITSMDQPVIYSGTMKRQKTPTPAPSTSSGS